MKNNASKPWVSNYPPLQEWLRKTDAVCHEQIPVGKARAPVAYLEKWVMPNGRAFILEIRANRMGWDIYTAAATGMVAETLEDADRRLKDPVP